MSFDGFPEEALEFYEGLEADNSKAYWGDHKSVYDSCVKAPVEALLAALEPEFGSGKLFRPYRDVRFSKDKTLYKTAAGATAGGGGGSGVLYVQLSAAGLLVAGGAYQTTTDQARRLRAAAADERAGAALERVLAGLGRSGLQVGGDRLKRVPKEHAEAGRDDLVTLKTLTASRSWVPAEWLHTPEALDRVAETWRALGPLNRWLAEHVGPPREVRQR